MTTDTQHDNPDGDADGMAALDALEAEALAIEGAGQQKQAEAQAQQEQSQIESAAAELLSCLEMVRLMAAPALEWWQAYEKVWSDAQLERISVAGASVMVRHGWTMGELMTQWGPYIALVGAVLPPSLVTYQAIKQKQADEKREKGGAPQPARPLPPIDPGPVHLQEGIRL